jgi:UDP-2,3-diacylglucosamine pyrophosphatase LpxH
MKAVIITDQHFGCRKNSKLFHDYFLQFYNNVFFPALERENITTVIDMGDTFDSRKGIDFSALSWAKKHYYDRLENMGVKVITVVGNHTAYYKNTNEVNAIDLLLREYENVQVVSRPTELKVGDLKVLFVPWINQENEQETVEMIQSTNSTCVMGHLELKGFNANKFCVMEHGHESKLFKKFDLVLSGHYHTRSQKDNVRYLGNPYEMYWTDVDDERGFHFFETETLELTVVNNPYKMFHKVFYDDTPYQTFDATQYQGKIVKVIVRKKSDSKKFEKFINKLYTSNIAELKVVENTDFGGYFMGEETESLESEDTMSILNRYIQDSEIDLDKSVIQGVMQEVYQEACEMV